MLEEKFCKLCGLEIEPAKRQHKQTRYHDHCAREMKKRNTLPSWSPEQRRTYMRDYMRRYRQRRRSKASTETRLQTDGNLSSETARRTFVIGAPLILWVPLSFESVLNFLKQLHLFVLEAAALGVVAILAWQHLRRLWKK